MAEHELNKIVDNDGEVFNLRDSSKLGKTGDASNTTSTFTKASGDTSSITSGSKLSAIFTAISSFFASLKSLAFKDKVTDSDISGTVSDSHIASASTWNGKYTKPSTGIPKTDLASSVQTSLGKADTALQKHQDITGKADKVRGATAGNFAGLDSNGNLVDSGKSYSDLEGNYKLKQTAKVSPAASGSALSFIDTVSQDENGEITATKKTVTVDSTYSSAGTNPVNGKAVAAAIGTLDVNDISGFGAGKTLATLTETDGKVAATFQDIEITKSQVSDFPTEMTPSSHTHGNITNDGKIGTTANLPVITGTGGAVTTGSFSTTASAVGTSSAAGTANTFSRGDHVHSISLATGDSDGQVKIAGSNVSVAGWDTVALSQHQGTKQYHIQVNNTSSHPKGWCPIVRVRKTSGYGSFDAIRVSGTFYYARINWESDYDFVIDFQAIINISNNTAALYLGKTKMDSVPLRLIKIANRDYELQYNASVANMDYDIYYQVEGNARKYTTFYTTYQASTSTGTAITSGKRLEGNIAYEADKLSTSRTIQTDLASTSSASFNGTANITPGVTGTLPVANGGTGATTPAGAQFNLIDKATTELGPMMDGYRIAIMETEPSATNSVIAGYRTGLTMWNYMKGKMSSDTGVNISGSAKSVNADAGESISSTGTNGSMEILNGALTSSSGGGGSCSIDGDGISFTQGATGSSMTAGSISTAGTGTFTGGASAKGRQIDGSATIVSNRSSIVWNASNTHLVVNRSAASTTTIDLKNLLNGVVYWLHVPRDNIIALKNSSAISTFYCYDAAFTMTYTSDTYDIRSHIHSGGAHSHGGFSTAIVRSNNNFYVMMDY